ncbi:ABC transporter ATP-binding protein [Micromonospora peucetia]|uniref:ABC transporter ATP-binding protein n=1 Tax=Micromonospora peucetia TaxID=47871 RepID=A0A1C6UVL6_9ACTN|nr:ABC transporter ATP-binding protein [Micromonospora peucetia]MCX4387587.1 ABC transporter ATP-binding protein [Micromonospora peucetia]WSA34908.1 ABC transporter ATP-binding protein [Micromonospora peucetia]SCL58087.1 ABC-2 type transport system ATP-binding protein [Micromonospora peucetia]
MTRTHGATATVAFAGAVRTFGDVQAVAGLDLTIGSGERVALLGRNGAGKSTSISLLLGLDEPTAGQVRLFGDTPQRAVRAGRVGAMLQDTKPVPRVTVRELVAFVASTYPKPMPVDGALALAGLDELANRRVDRLSGGQAQRVNFAVALVGDPDLLVLDEPTAALDVAARRSFWASMHAFTQRGRTVLFSTHYLEEADQNADRVVVIDQGRVIADGSGTDIKQAVGASLVSFDLQGRPAPAGLASLPGVLSVTVLDGRVRLRTADSDATAHALAQRGPVRGLEVTSAGLEDAFLALTSAPSD